MRGKEGEEDGEEVEIKASRNLDGIGKHGRSVLGEEEWGKGPRNGGWEFGVGSRTGREGGRGGCNQT